MKEEIIKQMQLCPLCSPFFDREKTVLAHEIDAHVRVFDSSYTTIAGERVSFKNEGTWAPLKGHMDYKYHKI